MTPPTRLPPAPRHLSLDALRGVAVMGILAMNIIAFSMPQQAYINPLAWGGTSAADLGLWAVNMVLVDGKMRGLFSLLFGASLLLVVEGAEARGEDARRVHVRRMLWLALFGTLHLYLVWYGDILLLYAVVGLAAFAFRDKPPEALITWGLACVCITFLIFALSAATFLFLQHAATQPGALPRVIESYRATLEAVGATGSKAIQAELATYAGSYAGIVAFRTTDPALTAPLNLLLFSGFETLGFMLIGMALLRNGFLAGAWAPAAYRRIAIRAYAIGIPPMVLLCAWCFASGFEPITTFNAVMAWAVPFRLVLILAHAALALWLITTYAHSPLVGRIAAAGRVAFTNYLGTSLVMTTLFYGYGLGLFGQVSRAGVYLFVLAGWAVMLGWSRPWLARFAYGPLEWLWRSLARGAVQQMRR